MFRSWEEEEHLCTGDIELAHRSEGSEGEQHTELPNIGRLFRGGLLVTAVLGVVAFATLHSNRTMPSTSTGAFQQKVESSDFSSQAFAAPSAAAAYFSPSPAPPGAANGFSAFFGPSPAPSGSGPVGNPLAPEENLNDGNKCADDEESLNGLCYYKCCMLTSGQAPVRVSAFGCAQSKSLGDVIGEKTGGFIPCQGYDVAGAAEGHGCPHPHGACLTDEELSLGKCYKKCSSFDQGQYPHRTSMATCCKFTSFLQCLQPGNFKMDFAYAVGGGKSVHKAIHDPIQSLTEA